MSAGLGAEGTEGSNAEVWLYDGRVPWERGRFKVMPTGEVNCLLRRWSNEGGAAKGFFHLVRTLCEGSR